MHLQILVRKILSPTTGEEIQIHEIQIHDLLQGKEVKYDLSNTRLARHSLIELLIKPSLFGQATFQSLFFE